MSFSIYVYATKRGEETLIAHGGTIPDEHWTGNPKRKGKEGTLLGHPAKMLDPLRKFDGKDPAELLVAVTEMLARTPHEDRWVKPYLHDLQLACEHWLRCKSHRVHAKLYDTARVVVVT